MMGRRCILGALLCYWISPITFSPVGFLSRWSLMDLLVAQVVEMVPVLAGLARGFVLSNCRGARQKGRTASLNLQIPPPQRKNAPLAVKILLSLPLPRSRGIKRVVLNWESAFPLFWPRMADLSLTTAQRISRGDDGKVHSVLPEKSNVIPVHQRQSLKSFIHF